jgi:hypothetical protein
VHACSDWPSPVAGRLRTVGRTPRRRPAATVRATTGVASGSKRVARRGEVETTSLRFMRSRNSSSAARRRSRQRSARSITSRRCWHSVTSRPRSHRRASSFARIQRAPKFRVRGSFSSGGVAKARRMRARAFVRCRRVSAAPRGKPARMISARRIMSDRAVDAVPRPSRCPLVAANGGRPGGVG